jgi:uncharacterized protein
VSGTVQKGFVDVPVDADSAWWWAALAEDRLMLPRCDRCERCFFPPQPTCPYCGSSSWQAIESAGTGQVYSWVVIHTALNPAFAGDVPYTIVAVELDEGVRVLGRLREEIELAAGMRLEPYFYEAGGRKMLGFQP